MPAPQRPATGGGNQPVYTVRHRSLKAAIWKNETSVGPMYNVTIARAFRDENGVWKDGHSIGYDDLMNVAALMYEAHAYISELRAKENGVRGQPARRGSKSSQ